MMSDLPVHWSEVHELANVLGGTVKERRGKSRPDAIVLGDLRITIRIFGDDRIRRELRASKATGGAHWYFVIPSRWVDLTPEKKKDVLAWIKACAE